MGQISSLNRGGSKGPVDEELPTIKFAFASVVTIKDIRKGESFTRDNLWVKTLVQEKFLLRTMNLFWVKNQQMIYCLDSSLNLTTFSNNL